jgi:multidrug efflux system membrane fusion protein
LDAALGRARGALARAQAQVKQAQALVSRYQPLVKIEAVSRQEYDDALAALQTAQANQQSAQADVKTAQLDLGYASVRAPISGRIGRGLVTEGSLVGQGESTPMALIQQIDPIYADFRQPVNAVLKLREAVAGGQMQAGGQAESAVSVRVDGTNYTAQGKLLFSDVSVDPGTGQVLLRGEFSNPDGSLLPGMYVRVSAEQGMDRNAIFVPQRAVMRGADGQAKLLLVSAEGQAEERTVQTGAMQGTEWQITQGLAAGDKVIVEGAAKIPAGTPVTVKKP